METSSIVIRNIAENDYAAAAKVIVSTLMPYWLEQKLPKEVLQEQIKKHDKNHVAAKAAGNPYFIAEDMSSHKVVGIIGLRKNEDSIVYNRLSTFFIDPEYQGKGIGRLLFEKVKEESIKRGCQTLVVSSSPKAEKIYEHLGFKKIRVDKKEYYNGTSHYTVWMEQLL